MHARRVAAVVMMLVVLGAVAAAALWDRLDTSRQLPPPLAALQVHLRSQGVDATGRLAPRGGLSRVRQLVHFSVPGSEQPFFVMWCESPDAAQDQLQRLQRAPRNSLPQANGEFVIYLTEWPPEAALTRRVIEAFRTFQGAVRASP